MDQSTSQHMVPSTRVRYIGIGELTVYLISEDELSMLERGSPSSTYLNLAIFFLSIGLTFLGSYTLSDPVSIKAFVVIVAAICGSLIAGSILLVLWMRSAKDASSVARRIRARGISSSETTISSEPISGTGLNRQ